MDYIKEAEKYLENYKRLEKANENLAFEISKLNMSRTTNNLTQHFDITGIRGSKNDMDPYNQIYQWTQLKALKTANSKAMENIEKNLEFLSMEPGCEKYGELLRLWYIDKADKDFISQELNYCVPEVYKKKNDAIKKFAIQLFGIRAVV